MPLVSVRIPQMGEGLQEARLVEFLKRPGDAVRRDEPIYVMETDKAITEVESPFSGTLVEWTVEPDSVLPIGTEIARMQVNESVEVASDQGGRGSGHGRTDAPSSTPATHNTDSAAAKRNGAVTDQPPAVVPALTGNRNVPIPPRTRKYLREKGLLAKAAEIPAQGKKLLPEDIDRYLAAVADATVALAEHRSKPPAVSVLDSTSDFFEAAVPKTQQTLNYRMQRGSDACIPAVLEVDLEWRNISAAREVTKQSTGETGFSMLVWCVVQAMRHHDRLRSTISGDGKVLRTYQHVNIGVAVAVEDGLLRTAVVRGADRLNRASFAASLRNQIERVRAGEDQIDATTTVTVSNIGSGGVRMGIPVVVTPAVATLALGQIRMQAFPLESNGFQFRPVATLTVTFDHRVLNGIAAAEFLRDVQRYAESFTLGE